MRSEIIPGLKSFITTFNFKQNVFLHTQRDKKSLKRVPELRDFLYGDLTSSFLRTKVCLEIMPTVSNRDPPIEHKITKKSLITLHTKNDQFEKVAEAIPTAVFYNEAGEEVEKVKLEGLSRSEEMVS